MEMLKFLTQKLRQQSLNEVQHYGLDDDRDSGTESDEENAELEALERAMQLREEDQENAGHHGLHAFTALAPAHCSSPSNSVTVTKRPLQQVNNQELYRPDTVPFVTISQQQARGCGVHHYSSNSSHSLSASSSPQGSSDFERCSLDYEPDSSTEFDRHSSEEELSVIHSLAARESILPPPENKRKWSQVNGRCSSCNTDSSGSSDEEVRELLFSSSSSNNVTTIGSSSHNNSTTTVALNTNGSSAALTNGVSSSNNSCTNNSMNSSSTKKGSSPLIRPQPLLFSASPPRGVHKLTSRYHYSYSHHYHHHHHHHHSSHHPAVSPKMYLSTRPHHHHALSPRKRHRQNLARDVSDAALRAQRPCLDFEKMQVSAPFFICIEPVMTMTSGVLG